MENLTVNAETLKALGVTDEAGLIALLNRAKETTGTSDVTLDTLKAALLENKNEFAKMLDEREAKDAAVLDELEKKGLADTYKSADEQGREKMWNDTLAKYGDDYAKVIALALEGNAFKNLMVGPNPTKAKAHELTSQLREVHDLAITITAMNGGISKAITKDEGVMNRSVYNEAVEGLVKRGYEGADLYQKAAADAFDTETAGDGLEWLPVNLSADLIMRIFLPLKVASLFEHVPMTSKSMKRPRLTGRARAGIMGEAKLSTDYFTNMAPFSMDDSTDITYAARKLGVSQMFSDEIEYDAIIPVARQVLRSTAEGIGSSIEDAMLNGSRDTFNDLDNASAGNELWTTTALAQGRDAWDGIRKALTTPVKIAGGGALTTALLRSARKSMGRYGVNPAKLVWVIGTATFIDILGLAEVITLEKYGPAATILQGEIGKIDGIPIVLSEYIYANLQTTGVYTGAGNTKTVAVLVYTDAWTIGDRQLVRIEQDRQITSQQNVVVGTWRGDFRKIYGSELTEAAIINLPG